MNDYNSRYLMVFWADYSSANMMAKKDASSGTPTGETL
jgi:hypothetical protein